MSVKKTAVPNKLYFKIGEVARIVGVAPYVLRYWETEFAAVRPGKTRSRQRLYRRRDVETLLEVKRLLHEERFTIEGARRQLKGAGKSAPAGGRGAVSSPRTRDVPSKAEANYRLLLERVRKDLQALHKLLN